MNMFLKNNDMKRIFTALTISVISLFSVSAQTAFEDILPQFHADSLRKTVEDLVSFDNRLCCATEGNNRKVAQYIVERLHSYGIDNAAIDSFRVEMKHWLFGNIDQYMYNVKSRINGSVKPDSIVILGAHLDAIAYVYDNGNYVIQNSTPGANDNATGIAVMIEASRIFHANNLTPKYSIDFMAFDAEEIGLCGSKHDANERKNANEKVYVMLNNDMVGLQTQGGVAVWQVTFHSEVGEIKNKATNICKEYTQLQPNIPDITDTSYQFSDSWEYRKLGFRTFYTHEYEADPHYHTTSDTPERLNYQYMAEITKLHFSLLYDFTIESITEETGIKQLTMNNEQLTIYPNPTKGQLTIDNGELIIGNVEIYDVFGRKQEIQEIIVNYQSSTINSIDVSHLAKGMYFLKIGNQVVRFVKE